VKYASNPLIFLPAKSSPLDVHASNTGHMEENEGYFPFQQAQGVSTGEGRMHPSVR